MHHKRLDADSRYRQELLKAILKFLHSTGVPADVLEGDIAVALKQLPRRPRDKTKDVPSRITSLGSILHRWHNERPYLDSRAKPRPLRFRGRVPSLESLIRAERLLVPPSLVLNELKALKLVKRSNRGFVPAAQNAIVNTCSSAVVQYAAAAIDRILSTVQNNTSSTKELTYIERSAFVPNLPERDLRDFCAFAQVQGEALIGSVNDWLEARRHQKGDARRTKLVPAGLHLYAFSNPPRASSRKSTSTHPGGRA
jgi:hypothetical protein